MKRLTRLALTLYFAAALVIAGVICAGAVWLR